MATKKAYPAYSWGRPASRSSEWVNILRWTELGANEVQVACRGADVAMAQQLLDGEEVHAALQQVGGETVAQGVRATALHDPGTVA